MGFLALRRLQRESATYIEFTSPDCAAPSGFLNLLTLSFRFKPLRPCFMPVTPLSFYLQGFPPIYGQQLLSKLPSPHALCVVHL